MPIVPVTLGAYTFAEGVVASVEEHREVGGRDARKIRLSGLLQNFASLDLLTHELDEILRTASSDADNVPLSVRGGRVLYVRRTAFTREVNRLTKIGRFVLDLEADDPFEYDAEPAAFHWNIAGPGDTTEVFAAGSVHAYPVLTFTAAGAVASPSFSSGGRTLRYEGLMAEDQVLVIDSARRIVTLDGLDVTPYTSGLFPFAGLGASTFVYTEDGTLNPAGTCDFSIRGRWW